MQEGSGRVGVSLDVERKGLPGEPTRALLSSTPAYSELLTAAGTEPAIVIFYLFTNGVPGESRRKELSGFGALASFS